MRVPAVLVAVALLGFGLAGCAGTPGAETSGQPTAEPTQISIAAAASLQRSFDEIAANFEKEHEDIEIKQISYDGSSSLATQILEGAPVDIFASADERNMATIVDAGLADSPKIFATNTLVLAFPADNPAQVKSLADLSSVTTVLCAPKVPCGAASEKLLAGANVKLEPASLEQNVGAVLQKISTGEADAGLVYRTDVSGDDSVASIVPPGADQVVNSYPISVIKNSRASGEQAQAAQAFVDYVLSESGQSILSRYDFGNQEQRSND